MFDRTVHLHDTDFSDLRPHSSGVNNDCYRNYDFNNKHFDEFVCGEVTK